VWMVVADMRVMPIRQGSLDGIWSAASMLHVPCAATYRRRFGRGDRCWHPEACLVCRHRSLLRRAGRRVRTIRRSSMIPLVFGGGSYTMTSTSSRGSSRLQASRYSIAENGSATVDGFSYSRVRSSPVAGVWGRPVDARYRVDFEVAGAVEMRDVSARTGWVRWTLRR
jgi:hypothetical protein